MVLKIGSIAIASDVTDLNCEYGTPSGFVVSDGISVEISSSVITVSYTHLDVYKRQLLPKHLSNEIQKKKKKLK